MEIKYKPSFIKDFNKIKDRKTQEVIHRICFHDVLEVENILKIKNLKKIKGYDNYYRIRKGDYRIGFRYETDQLIFMRVLKRSEIYRYFP
jgi:addiction module RelE/StbE family toxin